MGLAGLEAVFNFAVSIYLQRKYAPELAKHAEQKIDEALNSQRSRFEQEVDRHAIEIAGWKAKGLNAILYVELELSWQNTEIGQVLMGVDLISLNVLPNTASPPTPGCPPFWSEFGRSILNGDITRDVIPIPLQRLEPQP